MTLRGTYRFVPRQTLAGNAEVLLLADTCRELSRPRICSSDEGIKVRGTGDYGEEGVKKFFDLTITGPIF